MQRVDYKISREQNDRLTISSLFKRLSGKNICVGFTQKGILINFRNDW